MKKKKVKKQASKSKQAIQDKKEVKKQLSLPSILVIISAVLLLIQGAFSALFLFFRNEITSAIEQQGLDLPTTIQSTITIIGFFGIVWIILSLLMFLANTKITKTSDKFWMWFLFVLSILVLFTGAGMYTTGALALIGSIIYIIQKNKH